MQMGWEGAGKGLEDPNCSGSSPCSALLPHLTVLLCLPLVSVHPDVPCAARGGAISLCGISHNPGWICPALEPPSLPTALPTAQLPPAGIPGSRSSPGHPNPPVRREEL